MSAAEHVALVTGGSRGIGEAIARRIAREGVTVLIAARDQKRCKALAEELRAEGGHAWPIALDVTDPGSVARAAEEARLVSSALGPVDWLVNCAGAAALHKVLKPKPEDEDVYARQLELNFHGARRAIEAFLPDMAMRAYGRIVNVASSAGLVGYANLTAYCAAKHALVGYGRALAKEMEKTGVTVNAVCPHYVASPMVDGYVKDYAARTGKSEAEWRAWFAAQNPGGKLVDVRECAEAVWQALGDERTGLVLELDGSSGIRLRNP
jgi:NAD(P)-dependent dehydrogenase (short-subunit alcohol dehydrogenase family)